VNYIGYKPNEYIKEHLKDYQLFVYPSIWEETFCISLLEAMAAGLYCVTTNLVRYMKQVLSFQCIFHTVIIIKV
jgi:glycosyltransferase involved in cell wall biosynthesis